MYSNKGLIIALLLMWLFCTSSNSAELTTQQEAHITLETALLAQPAKCVTLTQGRTCFATVTLRWQAPQNGNYCIYQSGELAALQCWQAQQSDTMVFEFESNKTIEYQLIALEHNRIIAQAQVEVSWVHKASPRKRRWRLF